MTRTIVCVFTVGVAGVALAAPVPKTVSADAVLARVTVEHVGSALAQPGLRKELSLTAEQEKKFAALSADFEEKLKKASGPEMVVGPFDATQQVDLFKNIAVTVAEFDAAAVKLLTGGQHRRLRQVQLQKGGPAALLGRHAVRALALTTEQEDAMAADLAKYRRAAIVTEELIAMTSEAMFEPGAEVLPEGGEASEELKRLAAYLEKDTAEQDKVRQAMLKHLTAEQRMTWTDLIGKPVAAPDLLRAGSMFGDARVVRAMTKSHTTEGVPPPVAQPVPILPPPPPGQLPPVAPPPAQLPPPVPPPGE